MKHLGTVLASAAALLFLIGAAEQPPVPGPLEVMLEVGPTSYGPVELLRRWHPDTYTCSAWIFDAPSHKVVALPKVVITPGQEASTSVDASGLHITLKGKVDAEKTSAAVDVAIVRGAELITHQRSRVVLRPTASH